jgi:nucleoside-diphosphate-sugar epimerase
MLEGRKILITGITGQIAFSMGRALAASNEVWGLARFSAPDSLARVQHAGVIPFPCDLVTGHFPELPDDFEYVAHLATVQGETLTSDESLRSNAESAGLLMKHCRSAKGVLVMSSAGVYRNHDEPMHPYKESDPLGDAQLPRMPDYSISKIAAEAVARTSARMFDIPTIITRMNAAYGPGGGLPAYHLDRVVAGEPVVALWEPYSPIYEDDICDQLEPLLEAASVPAVIVNWGGDEVVFASDWCNSFSELAGRDVDFRVRDPIPGGRNGAISDPTLRISITGPCKVPWREGMRRMYEHRYPSGPQGPANGPTALNAALSRYQLSGGDRRSSSPPA